jgi:hypothetical protein
LSRSATRSTRRRSCSTSPGDDTKTRTTRTRCPSSFSSAVIQRMFRTGSPAGTRAAQGPPNTISGRGDRAWRRRHATLAKISTNCGPRMAGMRPFVLCEESASAYYQSLAAADCPSSQIAIDKLSAVPLWKVIVGSRRLTANRARKGPVFFFHSGVRWPLRRSRFREPPVSQFRRS